MVTVKAVLSPGGLFIFWSLRGGVNREGGLFLTHGKKFYSNGIPSAVLPLKSRC